MEIMKLIRFTYIRHLQYNVFENIWQVKMKKKTWTKLCHENKKTSENYDGIQSKLMEQKPRPIG